MNSTLLMRLLLAAAFGWLLDSLHVPVAWLLGPMVAGILIVARTGRPEPIHPSYQAFGQAVLGLFVGIAFPLATLQAAMQYALPLLLAVTITGGLSLLNGHLLSRWTGIDPATGFLGSLPGAAPSMVAMSDELGADPVAVAILQYVRLMLVVAIAPLAVGALFPAQAAAGPEAAARALPAAPVALSLLLLAAAGAAGVTVGRWLRLPSPTFLGSFLAVLPVSWLLPYSLVMPEPVFDLGMLLVGFSIGVRFDMPMVRRLGKMVLVEVVLVIGLIGLCLGVGYLFHLLSGVDTVTAVLGSTPGGTDVMVASSLQLGADAGLVLAMQMTRWFLVLLAGPWVAGRLGKRRERTEWATPEPK